jgi:hypothetical protein
MGEGTYYQISLPVSTAADPGSARDKKELMIVEKKKDAESLRDLQICIVHHVVNVTARTSVGSLNYGGYEEKIRKNVPYNQADNLDYPNWLNY